MEEQKRPTAHGRVAGLLAATTVAIWFLGIDFVQGRPLYTPAFLVRSLFGLTEAGPVWIAVYTVFHYIAFVAVGMGTAWVLAKIETMTSLLVGVVLGFLLFDVMFYSSIVMTGSNVVEALGWPNVLAGNVLAGVVLTNYLHRMGIARPVSWAEVLREHRIVREGLIAGLLGASMVVLWFLAFDLMRGQILFTPAALGSAIFHAADAAQDVVITTEIVLAYTALHFAAFLVTGMIAAALANEMEKEPALVMGGILAFVTFESVFIGLVLIYASWILDTLGWMSIASGNLIAVIAMGGYLLRAHPALRKELREIREHSYETPL